MAFKFPFRLSSATVAGLGVIGAFALAGAVIDGPARAQVAAKVESQTRPNFGILLDPPTRSSGVRRQHRRWSYRDHNRWGPGHGYPPPPMRGGEEIVLIDCGGNPGSGGLENAVARVRPGGMLVIRSRGGPCVGWMNIDKPMTIVGDARFQRRAWDQNPAATIQAPDGLPCMTVAQGVRVEVRDLVFEARNARDAACVVSYGGTVMFENVGIRHAGDETAIYADGGALDLRDSVIDSQTVAPAVIADGAVVTAHETDILRAQSGMELTPGAGQVSILNRVSMRGTDAPNNFGPRAIGLLVRASRDYGRVEVSGSRICGYVEGVAVEGASVEVKDSRICRADKGAVLYNGELVLTGSRVRAETLGVAAASGRAVITENIFSGVQRVVFAEQRASVEERNNQVYSRHDVCRPQFRPRWRDRHEPYFGGGSSSYRCNYQPYPQNWWAEEEGWLGLPYYDDSYALDGHDRYQSGYGWYDRDGRYIYDDRYRGDARWRGGGWRR